MDRKATILAYDDDQITQTVIKDFLEEEGYKVIAADSGRQLLTLLDSTNPDLILLDVILQEEDGLLLIRSIKDKTPVPVLIISEKNDTTDKIVGLEIGADDYMGKPVNLKELAARIKAHIRMADTIERHVTQKDTDKKSADLIRFGEWCLNRKTLQVINSNEETANLTTGEFHLLEALALSSNQVLSREQLFEITRQEDFESFDRAIDVQIARIRKKIGDDPRRPRYIKTVRGVGYMLDSSEIKQEKPESGQQQA